MKYGLLLFFFCINFFSKTFAQKRLTVHADQIKAKVSPTMWGIFFEDINFGADGGLYAELVKNRSFEFASPLMGWKETKSPGIEMLIVNASAENPNNPRYLKVKLNQEGNYPGLINEGFRGIGIQKGETYLFSILVNQPEGDVKLKISLLSQSGNAIANSVLENFTSGWKKYSITIQASDSASKGKLQLQFEGKGSIGIDMISLFPKNTWKQRSGGLRADLVQWLADMQPGFLRFPGGCIVEGRDLANRYQWKTTLGNPDERKTMINRWNTEFRHRPAPDYFQSFGLGFYEYFLLSEDIGAEPLPILNCGMACQYNTGEVAAMEELDPYIQDALDLIEFANGSVQSRWGKLRSELGHPQPFHLKILGIGNEQWDVQYLERYKKFDSILRKQYPEIKLVAAAGPAPAGKMFDYAWTELRKLNADLIDEHYYQPPSWFLKNANRYDQYDRKGPKVFAGEYAAHAVDKIIGENRNNWEAALAEAAFMTGLERNADVVEMASYAPLFAHVDAWQWAPDLIWFDNLNSYGTANYYVQKLFATNKGTHVLSLLENGKLLDGKDSIYGSAVMDSARKQIIIKLVNAGSKSQSCKLAIEGRKLSGKEVEMEVLTAVEKNSVNSLEKPQLIYPTKKNFRIGNHDVDLQPFSLNIIKIPVR